MTRQYALWALRQLLFRCQYYGHCPHSEWVHGSMLVWWLRTDDLLEATSYLED